jgi:hypothetical protein
VGYFGYKQKFLSSRIVFLIQPVETSSQKQRRAKKTTMMFSRRISRRTFVQSTSLATAGAVSSHLRFPQAVALAAKKTGQQLRKIETAGGPMSMLPFSAIADQQYSTYVVAT